MSTKKDGGAPVVVVVGTGFGGIAAGVNLKLGRNLTNFIIIEKSYGVGGTWRHQRYPGAACDVPCHYYSLSFELNPDWSSEYPPRVEMKAYMERTFEKYGLGEFTRWGTEIVDARWNEDDGLWDLNMREYAKPKSEDEVKVADAEGQWDQNLGRSIAREYVLKANWIFNSSGAFTQPYTPDYPGIDSFKGHYVHTTEWDEKYDFEGKRIGIVGSGPTAIQVVSQLAEKCKSLDMYQRTPNWIFPNPNLPFTEEQKAEFRNNPAALIAKRQALVDGGADTWAAIEDPSSEQAEALKQIIKDNYVKMITKEGVIPLITPDYPIGCKRILIDCNFLVQLNRENVNIVPDPIQRFTANGIVSKSKTTGEEKEREYDVIIWCTGWGSFSFGRAFPIYGRGGVEMWEYWRKCGNPRSYLGTMNCGFPNLILAPGPSGQAFTSYIEVLEMRVDFMLKCIDELAKRNAQYLEPKVEAEAKWAKECETASPLTPFAGNCVSYYKFTWDAWDEAGNAGGGHIGKQSSEYTKFTNPSFYPGLFGELREELDNADMETFEYGTKEGKWEMPERPAQDLSIHRLKHKKIREKSESLIARVMRGVSD